MFVCVLNEVRSPQTMGARARTQPKERVKYVTTLGHLADALEERMAGILLVEVGVPEHPYVG
jgi:hypothetical protein